MRKQVHWLESAAAKAIARLRSTLPAGDPPNAIVIVCPPTLKAKRLGIVGLKVTSKNFKAHATANMVHWDAAYRKVGGAINHPKNADYFNAQRYKQAI